MSKGYQKRTARTSGKTCSGLAMPEPSVPDVVSVAMDQIAADVREGLLAIAVGAGMQVLTAMMAADVELLCGPRGKHDPSRSAVRHGSEDGSVGLGGRRVRVRRPRVRSRDGSAELPVASYELFNGSEFSPLPHRS